MRWLAVLAVVAGLGLAGFLRLAPDDPARWHRPIPALEGEGEALILVAVPQGAIAFVPGEGRALLARLASGAEARARLRHLAGSAEEGRMTWVARSAFWGFPDYITAEIAPGGLRLWSRQRYGSRDYGVNLSRLKDWVAGF